ncbi:MAG TPA: asparagine synthase (glutamine-hydrolyzing), partial [Longimicrobiaceae bacterium]|nr:asparagine synthase (glutamine-hydrolyzing) [Longimicrobiaceae bacterium]
MCGIVAMRGRARPVCEPALLRATRALRHRGPDGHGHWIAPHREAGLGHTRLAIIGATGRQPIANEDETVHIVVNGEFYGFEEIRASLERRGHRFRTGTDSEIALHLYEEMGTRCVERLRGQFALVIWDARTGVLLAARDRFGIKPLFYHEGEGLLTLASECKALFAAGVEPRWDPMAVYRTLHACPDEGRSLYAGIRQIPPGHWLVATDGTTRLERYWDVPGEAGSNGDRGLPWESVVEDVRGRLVESVNLRMRADVPVGCLLSGGVDSSAILGVAARESHHPVAAFTVGFDDAGFDERTGAREAADFTGACHHVVSLDERMLGDHFAEAVRHAEIAQYNSHGTARYLLSREISRVGYKSVMAGEGADEAFMGYEFTRAAGRASPGRDPRRWLRLAFGLLRSPHRRFPGLAATSPWLARLASLLDLSPDLLARLSGGIDLLRSIQSAGFLAHFTGYDVYRDFYRACDEAAGIARWEPPRRLTYLWLHSLFVNYHLAADRLDMAHGVEVRLPYLDHVLFERLARLPLAALITPDVEKRLLRDAMRPFLPGSALRRPKKPFWAPPEATRGSSRLSALVQDT